MAIAFANLGASSGLGANNATNPDINNNTDLSSYANSSWSPPTDGLIVVFVTSRLASGTPNEPTISGNSLTWVSLKTQLVGARRITLFAALASPATTGATTIDFASQTQQHCTASFFQVTGADLTGGVAGAFVQTPSNSNASAVDTTGTVTLAAAGDSDNRPISGFYANVNETHAPRANWTELDDMPGSAGVRSLSTHYRVDAFETTADATWTTAAIWAGIAAEIKAASTGYTLALDKGTFTLSGQAAALRAAHKIASAVGAFVLSGKAAGLAYGHKLAIGTGAFVLTGIAISMVRGRPMVSATGIYTLTGQNAGLKRGLKVAAAKGTFLLTGQAAALIFGHGIVAAKGTFTLTGQSVILKAARVLIAVKGVYTLTGKDVTLSLAGRPVPIYGILKTDVGKYAYQNDVGGKMVLDTHTSLMSYQIDAGQKMMIDSHEILGVKKV